MDRQIKSFKSFEEAHASDREYYRSLTPSERVKLLLKMMRAHYGPPKPLERVLRRFDIGGE